MDSARASTRRADGARAPAAPWLCAAACVWALLGGAGATWAQPARAPGGPPVPLPPPPLHESLPLPEDLSPERPLTTPEPLRTPALDPTHGLHFGLGLPTLQVRSDALGVQLDGGKPASEGALVHVEAVWGAWRAGYARQWYRRDLPPGTAFEGSAAERLAFDSDQVWGFHGFRPAYGLYLGYGLGWQRRRVRVLGTSQAGTDQLDSTFLAGVMLDYAVGLPFLVQLRLFQDLSPDTLDVRGASLQLAYMVPF